MRGYFALGIVVGVFGCSTGSSPTEGDSLKDSGVPSTDEGFATDFGVDDTNLTGFQNTIITPANAVVKIDLSTGTAGKQVFKAVDLDGKDITATTTFTVDDASLGSFAGATFTSATSLPAGVLGKSTVVRGEPGKGVANVTVVALRAVSGDNKDFFFTVAYKKDPDPTRDVLKFGTNIAQVDVGIIVDTTASMGPEINNLRDALASDTGMIPKLKAAIPNVGIAIARHDDFPVAPFGFPGSSTEKADVPYELLNTVTTNKAVAQSSVFLLQPYRGGALPESQYEAQYQMLTGEGFAWTAAKAGNIAANLPPVGFSGGAKFRAGSLPVVVEITDASWFDKTQYSTPTAGALAPHSKEEVVAAYDKIKAKFVGVHARIGTSAACDDYATASCDSAKGFNQAVAMAQATGSVLDPSAFTTCTAGKCCTGVGGADVDPIGGKCPLVYQAKTDGTGVADGIVAAIKAISVGSAFDVTAQKSNEPANIDSKGNPVDATKFIAKLRAMGEGSAPEMCKARATKDTDMDGTDDTFVGVTVGEPVCFEVIPKMNDFVEGAKDAPQFFKAYIDVVGVPGSIKLDRREVTFLVPPAEQVAAK